MLDNTKKLVVFKAQTQNVQELLKTWEHIKRSLHQSLLNNNSSSAASLNRMLALTYCAWTEALFSKLIHTPHGFSISEIELIKLEAKKTVVLGWKKCVELALNRITTAPLSDIAVAKNTLDVLVDDYIDKPSQIRNKIAHGQVFVALNSKNDALNQNMTNEIQALDIVKLDILRAGALGLADIVEMLIESPEKNGMKTFVSKSKEISKNLIKMSSFTLQHKIMLLKKKRAYTP